MEKVKLTNEWILVSDHPRSGIQTWALPRTILTLSKFKLLNLFVHKVEIMKLLVINNIKK